MTSIVDLEKGPVTRIHWFIRHLSKNHQITVLSINDWWKASQSDTALYAQGFDIGNIQIIHLTERRISPFLQEIASAVSVNRLLNSIDLQGVDVHFNYNTLISGYSVARRLKYLDIDTVYDIADDLPKMIGNSPQIPAPLRPFGRLLGSFMLRRNTDISSKVCFITNNLRKLYPVPNSRAVNIPNGVDTELFCPCSAQSLKQELGLDGHFVIGFVGTLREWVDFGPVFTAIKELSEAELGIKMLIVGDEGGMAKAKDLAREHGILGRIVFTGTVPIVRVPAYTCCMDVCIMPLKFDNAQPISLFQYLACGKPVISTRLLEIPPDLVLYASNKEEYKKQILNLLGNQELAKDLGLRGRRYVEQNHSWSKIAESLERVLRSVSKVRSTQ